MCGHGVNVRTRLIMLISGVFGPRTESPTEYPYLAYNADQIPHWGIPSADGIPQSAHFIAQKWSACDGFVWGGFPRRHLNLLLLHVANGDKVGQCCPIARFKDLYYCNKMLIFEYFGIEL
jgi:hypothetical protein